MGRLSVVNATGLSGKETLMFDETVMHKFLFGADESRRRRLFELIKEDVFRVRYGEAVETERKRTDARLHRLHTAGCFERTLTSGDMQGVYKYDALIDVVALLDHSLEISIGVNFGLFASTVRTLGSQEQREFWMKRIESGKDFGCFAATELGHGSNVRRFETRADYDVDNRQFVLHSPSESAQKYWIGGAAQRATWAVVFAQLFIDRKCYGVHVFLVQLRDGNHDVMPGIRIADCGVKAGLNGVDNGRIWFTNCRIPRENMLTALSKVSPDGVYTSSFSSADAHFAAMLAPLTGGRVGIAYAAITNSMLALTIAIRYALQRRAFAPSPDAEEVPLMWYVSHQRMLMIPLATTFVYLPCASDLREMWRARIAKKSVTKDVHSLSAGFKALFSWFMQDTLQTCRESCGGQGYKLENRIAVCKADRDVMLTFEGANAVLMQQVGKGLLAAYEQALKAGGIYASDSSLKTLNVRYDVPHASSKVGAETIRAALCLREATLIRQLGQKSINALTKERMTPFEAWNQCLDLAQQASTAHMHRRIFDMHTQHIKIASSKGGNCDSILRLCGLLWAANEIDKDPSFLLLGCISKEYAKLIRETIPELCARLCKSAKALTDSFQFPDHILAPIAGDYVGHNSRAKL